MRAAWLLLALFACAPSAGDARRDELLSVLERSDDLLLRTRPALVAGKYARMSATAYDFFRGNGALFQHDWQLGRLSITDYPTTTAMVRGLGDPHPENFGILIAADGTAALEPNDFDAADRLPALYDVRRLCVGMALAARAAGVDPQPVAYAAALSWATSLGAPRERFDDGGTEPVLQDLFKRSARDLAARAELPEYTVVDDAGTRTFLRGPPDPTDPTSTLESLPPQTRDSLTALLAPFGFSVKDAVRELGAGVASWPRVRALVLTGEDDTLLEVKELAESGFGSWYAPAIGTQDIATRERTAAQTAWFRPDAEAQFFTSTWLGLPVQIRTESEANKGVKVDRLVDERGTPEAVAGLGTTLGRLLARVHANGELAPADSQGFALEQATFAVQEAQSVTDDQARLAALITERGPTLGLLPEPTDAPPVDFAALLGAP